MKCLLCDELLQEYENFFSIFKLDNRLSSTCDDCKSQFEPVADISCSRCCKKNERSICSDCKLWEEKGILINHKALYVYNEAMKDYFNRFKFQGDYALADVFSLEIKNYLNSYKDYTIVPVPLSSKSYSERGFNQVTAFLDKARVPYLDILQKANSVKQSSKNRVDRLATTQVFTINKVEDLPSKILLMDDIYTTGATLNLIKLLFSERKVKKIKTFSLSR